MKEKTFKILCPFCNEPWDARMETAFDYMMGTEDTGVYGEEVTIEIYCNGCNRLIYTKKDS